MKKIISILMCAVVIIVNCIPTFADSLTTADSDTSLYNTQLALYANTDSNGFTLLDHTESVFFGSRITRDGLIYYGNMGGESQVLPSNYSIGARLFSYCRDTKRSNGYYMTGCSVFVYSFDSSLEYLHGEYDDNGNLTVTTPDGSKLYSSMSNYSQDATTGALKVSSGVGALSAGTFSISANSTQALFCDLPIRFDDGSILEPSNPSDSDSGFRLSYIMDSNFKRFYTVTTDNPSESFFVDWLIVPGSVDVGSRYFTPSSFDYTSYTDLSEDYLSILRNYHPYSSLVSDDTLDFWGEDATSRGNLARLNLERFFYDYNSLSAITNWQINVDNVISRALSYGHVSSFLRGSNPAYYSFNVTTFFNNFPNYDDISVVAAIRDRTHNSYCAVLSNEFTVSSIMALRGSANIHYDDVIGPQLPDEVIEDTDNLTDFQSLFSYLRYLFDNLTSNIRVISNNLALNIRYQIESINWHSLIGTGFIDFSLSDILNGIRGIFSDTIIDTDYDLPELLSQLRPLLTDSRLSLPDLTGFLAPALNDLDIRPDGSFGNYLGGISTDLNLHLDSLFGDTQLALGDVNTSLGDLKTELGDIKNQIQVSVGDLSTEINGNIRNTFVPDVDVIKTRVERSESNLTNKFKFVEDIRDDFDDLKQTVENSDDSPPDMSFTLYGKTMYAVDWSMYNRYRSTIHNVFVAIGYILLIKYIYKTLPSTLGEGGD